MGVHFVSLCLWRRCVPGRPHPRSTVEAADGWNMRQLVNECRLWWLVYFSCMTSIHVIWRIVNILLVIAISVWATPTCRSRYRTEVVCIRGKDDYILQRGLVSDNNNTVAITLKDCRITDVELEAFKNVYNVEEIDLSSNKIANIKVGVFDNVRKLISLRLSNNLLTLLPLGLFDNLPRLQRLDLSDNFIKSFEPGIFNHLTKLVRLELIGNRFLGKEMDPNIFNGNPKLTYLRFSGNDMSDAPDELLNPIKNLSVLSLNNCSLTEVPKYATGPNLKTLSQLLLQLNQISQLDKPEIFVNLENLKSLDLIGNQIEHINEGVFKPLTKLNVIDLSFNKLDSIPGNLFENMVSVESVDLSNNLMATVPVNAFRGTRLKTLNLNSNRLSFLDNNFLLELRNSDTRLTTFNFVDNSFQCACLLEILNEVKKFKVAYNSDKYNGKEAVCFMTDQFTCMRHKFEFEYPIDMRQTSTEVII